MKNYRCPKCDKISKARAWNIATLDPHGTPLDGVDGYVKDTSLYCCPECGAKGIDGEYVNEIIVPEHLSFGTFEEYVAHDCGDMWCPDCEYKKSCTYWQEVKNYD